MESDFPLDPASEIEALNIHIEVELGHMKPYDLVDWLAGVAEHYWNKGFQAGQNATLEEIGMEIEQRMKR